MTPISEPDESSSESLDFLDLILDNFFFFFCLTSESLSDSFEEDFDEELEEEDDFFSWLGPNVQLKYIIKFFESKHIFAFDLSLFEIK
jgi:hypothetical protein